MSFGTIRELISLNNAEIVAHVHDNPKFLQQLFDLCNSERSGGDAWRNGYHFIRELFDISKPLSPQQQVHAYNLHTFLVQVLVKGMFAISSDTLWR